MELGGEVLREARRRSRLGHQLDILQVVGLLGESIGAGRDLTPRLLDRHSQQVPLCPFPLPEPSSFAILQRPQGAQRSANVMDSGVVATGEEKVRGFVVVNREADQSRCRSNPVVNGECDVQLHRSLDPHEMSIYPDSQILEMGQKK
jgi:hypothetical protein